MLIIYLKDINYKWFEWGKDKHELCYRYICFPITCKEN